MDSFLHRNEPKRTGTLDRQPRSPAAANRGGECTPDLASTPRAMNANAPYRRGKNVHQMLILLAGMSMSNR